MAASESAILEVPKAEADTVLGRTYEEQDFRALYEREYRAHQKTKDELARLRAHAAYLESRVEKLEGDIAYLKKLMFSKKTEEQPSPSQPAPAPDPKEPPKKHGAQPGHAAHPRKIPLHLAVQEQVHSLPPEACVCPICGLPLEELHSEESSYEVTVVTRRYVLLHHRRKKYHKTCACPHPLVTAPGPRKLFASGLYSMDFWIEVVVNKYAFALPLTRQTLMLRLEGLEVSAGVLSDGLLKLLLRLKPLYELLRAKIAFEKLVHADETRWRNWAACYQLEGQAAKAEQWLWGFFSRRYHVFVIEPSRGAKVVKGTLGQGEQQTILPILVCDRYRAYQSAGNTLAYCWVHVRRDFLGIQIKYPAHKVLVDWAQTWLNLIADLFFLNALRVQHRTEPTQFCAYQEQLQAVLERMQDLMKGSALHSVQAAQVESMKHHWVGLIRFMDDPDIPLDNNLAERELRTPVVGRKNFYGTHSDQATEATAIAYSILSTCKLHGLDPKKFLRRFLTTQLECGGQPMTPEQLETFLPHRYAELHPEDLAPP
jgi:transposase